MTQTHLSDQTRPESADSRYTTTSSSSNTTTTSSTQDSNNNIHHYNNNNNNTINHNHNHNSIKSNNGPNYTTNTNINNNKPRILVPVPPTNPFLSSQTSVYTHRANTIPPYVLDTLSKVHYKDQLNNNNVNNNQSDIQPSIKSVHSKQNDEEQYLSFLNDPFVKSLDNNWGTFISSMNYPATYPSDEVTFEKSTGKKDFDLDGEWGGDDRLKLALMGPTSSEDGNSSNEGYIPWWKRLLGLNHNKSPHDESKQHNINGENNHPKVRSTAGYWMSNAKRKDLFTTIRRLFVQNPLIPLFLRILIIVFSTCALALACTIYVFSETNYDGNPIQEQPSTIMAIVVNCCAIAYLIYIAYDEYNGSPLGLRDPLGKMRLIMLDLLFIIFSSANLSLTFNTLYDKEWVCINDNRPELVKIGIIYPVVGSICRRQRALCALLFLVVCLWVVTFALSIVRVVDRVSTPTTQSID
ncbi:hypothetical protein DFJ63DRAFT_337480 [Scheffersomyces coipomensis]|uniref:uncharacterized protein n=1 Tax=Scheffersomyces coipomensis TaxID=1788519 RepID=UPI00315CDAD6